MNKIEKSFDEWIKEGYTIRKGEHGHFNEECQVCFYENQVIKKESIIPIAEEIVLPVSSTRKINSFWGYCIENFDDEYGFPNGTLFPSDGSNEDIDDFGDF